MVRIIRKTANFKFYSYSYPVSKIIFFPLKSKYYPRLFLLLQLEEASHEPMLHV